MIWTIMFKDDEVSEINWKELKTDRKTINFTGVRKGDGRLNVKLSAQKTVLKYRNVEV